MLGCGNKGRGLGEAGMFSSCSLVFLPSSKITIPLPVNLVELDDPYSFQAERPSVSVILADSIQHGSVASRPDDIPASIETPEVVGLDHEAVEVPLFLGGALC